MLNSNFLNFLFLMIYKHKAKHLALFSISTLLIFLLSSVFFIASSLEYSVQKTLEGQSDIIVQKLRSGQRVDIDNSWSDDICFISGVSKCSTRIYGKYFFEPTSEYFEIVGVDFFDEQSAQVLQELIDGIDLKEFLSKNNMLVGQSVQEFMSQKYYKDYFNFKNPHAKSIKVNIYKRFPRQSNMVTSNMIIMPMELAKEILGVNEEHSTDIVLNVSNPLEIDNIKNSIISKHFDVRVILKKDILKEYENMYNLKGGVFLVLFLVALISFFLILYQKYSSINSSDKKEIGVLRAVGWSIKDILILKMLENSFIVVSSFVLGFWLAYIFVFIGDAPLLSNIFLGYSNLALHISYERVIDFGMLSMLFIFYVTPYLATSLLPVWKIATIDPNEVLR